MAAFAPADPSDREAFDERWRRIRESDDSTALVIEVDGKVVGSISSWTNEGEREVTYWIGREHWGRGIATRALAEFLADVERTRPIQASTADDNVGSQRVLEKCGSTALEYAAPSRPAEERSSTKSSSVSTPEGRALVSQGLSTPSSPGCSGGSRRTVGDGAAAVPEHRIPSRLARWDAGVQLTVQVTPPASEFHWSV